MQEKDNSTEWTPRNAAALHRQWEGHIHDFISTTWQFQYGKSIISYSIVMLSWILLDSPSKVCMSVICMSLPAVSAVYCFREQGFHC